MAPTKPNSSNLKSTWDALKPQPTGITKNRSDKTKILVEELEKSRNMMNSWLLTQPVTKPNPKVSIPFEDKKFGIAGQEDPNIKLLKELRVSKRILSIVHYTSTLASNITARSMWVQSTTLSTIEDLHKTLSTVAKESTPWHQKFRLMLSSLLTSKLVAIIDREWDYIIKNKYQQVYPRLVESNDSAGEAKVANFIYILLLCYGLRTTIGICRYIKPQREHYFMNLDSISRIQGRSFSAQPRTSRIYGASKIGVDCLATTIIHIDMLDFGGRNLGNDDFQEVVNVLSLMSTEALEALVSGKANKLLNSLDHKLPNQYDSGDCPTIYCLVVCNEKGVTPSYSIFRDTVRKMEIYASEGHKRLQSESYIIDGEAYEIDNVASGDPRRKWSKLEKNGSTERYPLGERRFIRYSQTRQVIREFCAAVKEQLVDALLNKEKKYKPLPWSIINIGWTRNASKRDVDHCSHDNSHRLKNLFESCLQSAAPGKGFYARMVRLMHPLTPKQAAIAEHVVSILSGSYHFYGGLNGSVGGTGVETSARKIPDEIWDETFEKVYEQGVFIEQKRKVVHG